MNEFFYYVFDFPKVLFGELGAWIYLGVLVLILLFKTIKSENHIIAFFSLTINIISTHVFSLITAAYLIPWIYLTLRGESFQKDYGLLSGLSGGMSGFIITILPYVLLLGGIIAGNKSFTKRTKLQIEDKLITLLKVFLSSIIGVAIGALIVGIIYYAVYSLIGIFLLIALLIGGLPVYRIFIIRGEN